MQTPSDQQGKWAQQDSNLRPLGDHPHHSGECQSVPDQHVIEFDHAGISPDMPGNSDGKVTADLGPRINPLNRRMLLAGLVSCAIVAAVVAGVVGWLS